MSSNTAQTLFMHLDVGAFFESPAHKGLVLMVTSSGQAAVVKGGERASRGQLLVVWSHAPVVVLNDQEILNVLAARPPAKPVRNFWKAGDVRSVGRNKGAVVDVFAGLFLYRGGGVGDYFSADGEVQVCSREVARQKAGEEAVALVHFDIFDWPSDRTLSSERAGAVERACA